PNHSVISVSTLRHVMLFTFFLYTAPAPSEIYTLSLHDALPIWGSSSHCHRSADTASCRTRRAGRAHTRRGAPAAAAGGAAPPAADRKSTRLNSSHDQISYAVFCLKKKKTNNSKKTQHTTQHDST